MAFTTPKGELLSARPEALKDSHCHYPRSMQTTRFFPSSGYSRHYGRDEGKKMGDPRNMNLLYTLGLYFAVDLGLGEITEDCITRALALVDYRQKATVFLEPIEARNDEGRLLKEIIREIRQHGVNMTTRELYKTLHAEDYGQHILQMVYLRGFEATGS